MPWPGWTWGLTGWTGQEILLLEAQPAGCCQHDTRKCINNEEEVTATEIHTYNQIDSEEMIQKNKKLN